ncbi:hypothetical protein GE09DRAFT_1245153 [Coniochaeta sp. 2T2.1]|nr:hypothetical protein GE09DRAFT_1245153 [Coniochaeta sp. 2T2.1]
MKMEVLQRQIALPRSWESSIGHSQESSQPNGNLVPVSLSITATEEERTNLLSSILSESTTPTISIATNEFRNGPDASSKAAIRKSLLQALRKGWNDLATEARFIRMVDILQQDGCTIFAGLVDVASFRRLIDEFTTLMNGTGSHAFLHDFIHLIAHPDFIKNPEFNNAFIHPLLIALMAYAMGGPVRMTDARGKDTQPISVNAQDNMLHVDNTPFRKEYKILLGWEKGEVKGPTGQNFTFLPGTQKGNRSIRTDGQSQPWSAENDSLFITDESISGVLDFQRDITGREPKIVEVEYPDQPITVLFSAGSVVHHRYRSSNGNPRSCVITAFHLASDHPGVMVNTEANENPSSLAELLIGYQNGAEAETFCAMLGSQAAAIESKIADILDESRHSTLVDTAGLALKGQELDSWRKTVINAPSATQLKFEAGHYISFADDFISREVLVDKLAGAMSYDKHGLLDLIIYLDGHEEIRKPARKSIWTMPRGKIARVLTAWLPAVEGYKFGAGDVETPELLQQKAHETARLIREGCQAVNFARENSDPEEQTLSSAHQLIVDLGESLTRCEKVGTYITTNLFLFLIVDQILPSLDWASRHRIVADCAVFLRAYVLVVEKSQGIWI